MPILGLLVFVSLACAQSQPVEATRGVGEMIVDTLLWIGTAVIMCSIVMALASLVFGGFIVFLTLLCGGPKAAREIWGKRERD